MKDNNINSLSERYPERKVYTVFGKVPSKSNMYKIVKVNGHSSLSKQTILKRYEQSFLMQVGNCPRMIQKSFRIDLNVFYADNRPDLDNSLKIILDCLQKSRFIKNDRLCGEIHVIKHICKNNPRIEFVLTEL